MLLSRLKELSQTDKIAVISDGMTLKYKELYERSQALANYLINHYSTKYPVAIFGDKENDIIVGMFAAVYAKKPYVILCDTYPEERLNYILKDCEADIVLNVSKKECNFNKPIISSQDINNYVIEYKDLLELDCNDINPEELACYIYTSGSTGNPKGVEITYGNLITKCNNTAKRNYEQVKAWEEKYGKFCTACISSYAFSISLDFYFMLGVAGTIWNSIPSSYLNNSDALIEYLIKINPSYFCLTPSLMKRLLTCEKFNHTYFNELYYILLGGEMLEIDVAREALKLFPSTIISNGYGSTETVASGMSNIITKETIDLYEKYVPIVNEKMQYKYLLCDKNGNPINEDSIIGEIVLFGDNVARGYHNLKELTKEKFITLDNGYRAFKTGDLAYRKNGFIYMTGRSDNQIKIGGNRIEIEDIENHLNKCSIISQSAIGINTKNKKEDSMVAFVVLKENVDTTNKLKLFINIKSEMAKMVEPYKIPQKIVFVNEIPKNNSEKIDRKEINRLANE